MKNKNQLHRALITVVCLFAWINTSFVGSQEQKKPARTETPAPTDKLERTETICPVYKVMQHSGYWTYYAVHCPGMNNPCSLDGPNTNLFGCTSMSDICQQARDGNGECHRHSFDKKLGDEGNDGDQDGNRPKHDPNPQPESDCDVKKTFVIRYSFKNDTSKSVHAQVYLIKASKAGYDPRFIAVGHEIEKPSEGVPVRDITNPFDVTRYAKRFHEVRVDLIPYPISTYKGTAEDPD